MFGEHVGWVVLALHLVEADVPQPDTLLDPQLPHRQVADPPNAAASTNTQSSGTVRMNPDLLLEAKVGSDALDAEALRRALHYS